MLTRKSPLIPLFQRGKKIEPFSYPPLVKGVGGFVKLNKTLFKMASI
jgi:hypothetical protein